MTTSKTVYRAGHHPLPSGVFVAPFPRTIGPGTHDDRIDSSLAGLRHLLLSQSAPAETAAIIMEPVLGEGGYEPAPARFLQGVSEICRENGILFIADEVQSGFGRTGSMFAVEPSGVTPDILVMAKGIASGFPISAVGASAEIMAKWPMGSHGGTYGGNPIGCAAAIATIGVLRSDGFMANVNERGEQLRAGLSKLGIKHGVIADVRGPGLMVAVEFRDPSTGEPEAARVAAVLTECRSKSKVLMMNAGTYGNVIRMMPPLVVTSDEVTLALDAIEAALEATT